MPRIYAKSHLLDITHNSLYGSKQARKKATRHIEKLQTQLQKQVGNIDKHIEKLTGQMERLDAYIAEMHATVDARRQRGGAIGKTLAFTGKKAKQQILRRKAKLEDELQELESAKAHILNTMQNLAP